MLLPLVAGLGSTAPAAPRVIDGPMNGNAFLAYVEQILAPTPAPVLDQVSAHKVPEMHEAVEASGVTLLYRPPYSPASNLLSLTSGLEVAMAGGPPPSPRTGGAAHLWARPRRF